MESPYKQADSRCRTPSPNTPCRFRNWFRNSASVVGDAALEQIEGLIDDTDLLAAYLLTRPSGDQLA
jgi:hypothetical protein